ncbi:MULTISPECIES: PD-(D/E)XK nuclease family protein [unclassified Roseateles]|uniref:PD-(D/E)XK nuclease family protein n=1 Tax=unclassified Roseateles TaxID=2626991 RepID=UPI00138F23DB|nr:MULTISPECIES: PD-(D/E)XK nuclease family protein [unclassified Roseateles]
MQALKLGLVPGEDIDGFWRRVAAVSADWLAGQGAAARDAVLLLPFAQQIAPARRAWLAQGGWQPRITTSRSLASTLAPTALAAPDQLSGDAAIDVFTADRLLADQSWVQPLKRSSARDYRVALARLVDTAQALARAAAQVPPTERPAFLSAAQQRLAALDAGPGLLERALAQVALAWVASDDRQPATDTLFALRPSAWIWLRAGGPDPLAQALLAGDAPALCLDAELDLDQAWLGFTPAAHVEEAVADDFETLAEQTATAVVQHLNAGRRPVALLAQDRVAIRRVRALLARQGVPVHDETGWTLATTPAAAALMALLRAALSGGVVDDWLAWLKSPLTAGWDVGGLNGLESRCRRFGWRQAAQLDAATLPPATGAVWQRARCQLEPLAGGARTLGGWLLGLGQALNGLGSLAEVEGGEALLETLWISRNPWAGSAHEHALAQTRLRPEEFLAWVDDSLEAAQFEPTEEPGTAEVIITPLARAMLRPFGAIVLPGADAATLGPVNPQTGLLADADAAALGLPSLSDRREAEALGFAQLLRAPVLTLLRCAFAGAEPLPPSPLLERLASGRALDRWVDERELLTPRGRPQYRAAATAQGRLPAALSASAIEALRNCPYQFFSRALLGLREADELEQEATKRDYGTWLHAVLKRFHESRDGGDDDAALRAAADAELAWLDAADFLPFTAAFERLRPLYLAWLAEAEARGQSYAAGEVDRDCKPFDAPLDGLLLKGRIDRIDDDRAGQTWLLDYKTGDAKGLKDKVTAKLEDTQLATYALLMGAETGLQAAYLVLDDGKGIALLPHEDVSDTALALRDGLQADLMAMRDGAPLPALGEGKTCDYCEARGLCRKDDWT